MQHQCIALSKPGHGRILAFRDSTCMDNLQCKVAEMPCMAARCFVIIAVNSTQRLNLQHRLTVEVCRACWVQCWGLEVARQPRWHLWRLRPQCANWPTQLSPR